jgi:eukaryotic-like serine/threonine-protein kinase
VSTTQVLHAARPTVLFVDDEERILGALGALFRMRFNVLTSSSARDALELVRSKRPHVVVSDQRMPNVTGVEFLRQVKEVDEACVRILLTGYSDLVSIVGSVNEGEVFRFVNKPWINQELRDIVGRAAEIAIASRQAIEGASAASPVPGEAANESAAVLVATRAREVIEIVGQSNRHPRPLKHATDVDSALQAIQESEVAVLVCDLDSFEGGDVMLKMLKQAHPRIQSVALAGSADSSELIGLINEAQIFRFMARPLRAGLIERAINSGMAAYGNFKAKPALIRRQSVETKPAIAESSIGRMILERIGLIRLGGR